jgi:hypothetical protein
MHKNTHNSLKECVGIFSFSAILEVGVGVVFTRNLKGRIYSCIFLPRDGEYFGGND